MPRKHKYGYVGNDRIVDIKTLNEEEQAMLIADMVNESIYFAYNYYDFDIKKILKVVADKLCDLVYENNFDFDNPYKFHEILCNKRRVLRRGKKYNPTQDIINRKKK